MNAVLNTIMDGLFGLLGPLGPVVLILVLAVVVSALSLYVFKWTSNQEAISRSKGRMKASILGMLIFRHDLVRVFKEMATALFISMANLRFIAVPMLFLIVPLGLLFLHMDLRLGRKALSPGDTTVLRVHLKETADASDVRVEPVEGVRVETPGIRVRHEARDLNEVDFRLVVTEPGEHEVIVIGGGLQVTKRITVDRDLTLISPVRPGGGFFDALFNPGEDSIPEDAPFSSIELKYDWALYDFLGIEWAWWLLFLVFMLPALFVLRKPIGVDF